MPGYVGLLGGSICRGGGGLLIFGLPTTDFLAAVRIGDLARTCPGARILPSVHDSERETPMSTIRKCLELFTLRCCLPCRCDGSGSGRRWSTTCKRGRSWQIDVWSDWTLNQCTTRLSKLHQSRLRMAVQLQSDDNWGLLSALYAGD
jgi:hypothetical protein